MNPDRILKLLESIERVCTPSWTVDDLCPCCRSAEREPHRADCELVAVIRELRAVKAALRREREKTDALAMGFGDEWAKEQAKRRASSIDEFVLGMIREGVDIDDIRLVVKPQIGHMTTLVMTKDEYDRLYGSPPPPASQPPANLCLSEATQEPIIPPPPAPPIHLRRL